MSALDQFDDVARGFGFRLELVASVTKRLPHLWKRRGNIADQLYLAGVKVVGVMLLVSFFIGLVVAYQTGLELAKLGQEAQIGPIVAISMAREMGPFIAGIVLSATVGSALAAEIGSMSVGEELAALEVLSVDAISYLVLPRVAALAIMCPLLTILCDTLGLAGGALIAQTKLHVGSTAFFESAVQALQEPFHWAPIPKDVYFGLMKAFVFGILIAIISCASGLRATGGALGVGEATRRAVRDSIVAIIVINFFFLTLFYQR